MRHIYADPDNWATINVIDLTWVEQMQGYIIQGVEVQKRFRGRGVARALMRQVLEDADREDARLFLAICPDPESTGPQRPLTYDELAAWYSRCGFTHFHTLDGGDNLYWRPRASERQDPQRVADPRQEDADGRAVPPDPDPGPDARLPRERRTADAP